MRRLLRAFTFLFLAVALWPAPQSLAAGEAATGVVVLHGKQGSPDRYVTSLVSELRHAGFLVSTPEMPWSARRGADKSYDDALLEIDAAVRELRAQGATRIVLAGHSLGGNAALGYAARYPGKVDALVCLAAAHAPEQQRTREYCAASVQQAREMVAAGRGQDKARFRDTNSDNRDYMLETTAQIYLSYNDPEGPAVMPKNAAAITAPLPILWVAGAHDPASRDSEPLFRLAPAHPSSRFVAADADHLHVPTAAASLVVEWLRGLGATP